MVHRRGGGAIIFVLFYDLLTTASMIDMTGSSLGASLTLVVRDFLTTCFLDFLSHKVEHGLGVVMPLSTPWLPISCQYLAISAHEVI